MAPTPSLTVDQWVERPRWRLGSEAVPLLLGEDPTRSQLGDESVTPEIGSWCRGTRTSRDSKRRAWLELLARDVDDQLLAVAIESGVNPIARIQQVHGGPEPRTDGIACYWVTPKDVVTWAIRRGMPLPDGLRLASVRRWPDIFTLSGLAEPGVPADLVEAATAIRRVFGRDADGDVVASMLLERARRGILRAYAKIFRAPSKIYKRVMLARDRYADVTPQLLSVRLLPADYWFRNDSYDELELGSVVPDPAVTAQNIAQLEQLRDEYGKDGRFVHDNATRFLGACHSNVPFWAGPQGADFVASADEARAVRDAIALDERGLFNPDLMWTEDHYLALSLGELALIATEVQNGATNSSGNSQSQDQEEAEAPVTNPTERPVVFIVHGHDIATRDKISAYLRKQTSFETVVLDEEPDKGRTIIEKFDAYGRRASFAIVIATPDDVGCSASELNAWQARGLDAPASPLAPRARQNVILEYGYFMGALGRDKVMLIKPAELQLPSDVNGVLETREDLRHKLLLELKHAGLPVEIA